MTDTPRCEGDAECTSGSRNRYFLGKRLTPAAFSAEQSYHVERRRLLNRAVHGWGVVQGLAIRPAQATDCSPAVGLDVGPGLALDAAGRELLVTRSRNLRWSEVWIFNDEAAHPAGTAGHGCGCGDDRPDPSPVKAEAAKAGAEAEHRRQAPESQDKPPEQKDPQRCWLLSVHYAERRIEPVQVKDDCHCERTEWDRVCEDVHFSLRPIDCAACCDPHDCELCCGCVGECEMPLRPHNRGPHRCLCRYLTRLQVDPAVDTLCRVRDGLEVDLANGVPLACVTLRKDGCGRPEFDRVVDACGPRRLVKRNDLLFDLIRGCDLTVIDAISWKDLHRSPKPIPAADFAAYFSSEKEPPARCVTKFWLRFSRAVQAATVTPDCFAITVIGPEEDSGWGEVMRVPITDLEVTSESIDPPGHVRAVTLVVDGEWVLDELKSKRSIFRNERSQVEIEVRGDFILDCNGQAIDANAVGLRPVPSGNGTPGGTFLSTFSVAPQQADAPAKKAA
jgi:hypothetical protein